MSRSRSAPPLHEARARNVLVTSNSLFVELVDGRRIVVPLEWYPALLHATDEQRLKFCMIGDGVGIHWHDLDEDLEIASMLGSLDA
mgnify:FL=1